MPWFRWPWQTREDDVIRLLELAIKDARKTQRESRRDVETARLETGRELGRLREDK